MCDGPVSVERRADPSSGPMGSQKGRMPLPRRPAKRPRATRSRRARLRRQGWKPNRPSRSRASRSRGRAKHNWAKACRRRRTSTRLRRNPRRSSPSPTEFHPGRSVEYAPVFRSTVLFVYVSKGAPCPLSCKWSVVCFRVRGVGAKAYRASQGYRCSVAAGRVRLPRPAQSPASAGPLLPMFHSLGQCVPLVHLFVAGRGYVRTAHQLLVRRRCDGGGGRGARLDKGVESPPSRRAHRSPAPPRAPSTRRGGTRAGTPPCPRVRRPPRSRRGRLQHAFLLVPRLVPVTASASPVVLLRLLPTLLPPRRA